MCLSTVYRGEIADDNLLLNNVQRIDYQNGTVTLTDILERQVSIEGIVVMADLTAGKVVVAPAS